VELVQGGGRNRIQLGRLAGTWYKESGTGYKRRVEQIQFKEGAEQDPARGWTWYKEGDGTRSSWKVVLIQGRVWNRIQLKCGTGTRRGWNMMELEGGPGKMRVE
jgi:hypothetical protein